MIIKGKTYTDEHVAWLFDAVEAVLIADEDVIRAANEELLEAAVNIGLVDEDDCNLG